MVTAKVYLVGNRGRSYGFNDRHGKELYTPANGPRCIALILGAPKGHVITKNAFLCANIALATPGALARLRKMPEKEAIQAMSFLEEQLKTENPAITRVGDFVLVSTELGGLTPSSSWALRLKGEKETSVLQGALFNLTDGYDEGSCRCLLACMRVELKGGELLSENGWARLVEYIWRNDIAPRWVNIATTIEIKPEEKAKNLQVEESTLFICAKTLEEDTSLSANLFSPFFG